MKSLGPLWALALTIDRDLAVVLLTANLVFAAALAAVSFRRRPLVELILVTLGVFLLLTVVSVVGLYWYARTPVRDVAFFSIE